jgi:hypothetical protein
MASTRADSGFQARACGILITAVAAGPAPVQEFIFFNGGVRLASDALRAFPADQETCRAAMTLLGIMSSHVASLEQMHALEICPPLCWAMGRFPEDMIVFLAGLQLMARLSTLNPSNAHVFENSDAPRIMAEVGKRFVENRDVQKALVETVIAMGWGLR